LAVLATSNLADKELDTQRRASCINEEIAPSIQAAINLPSIYDDVFDSADTHARVQTFRKSLHAIPEPGERFEACIGMRNRLLDLTINP
jgi:hypothetical protein